MIQTIDPTGKSISMSRFSEDTTTGGSKMVWVDTVLAFLITEFLWFGGFFDEVLFSVVLTGDSGDSDLSQR